ncbi:hypothetical protein DM860_003885 [Cuscuta australis]|uniref:Uncharacterized protein n=1 Tax=Cuscuta australis TaxID=267555 RepID=A0A328CZB4_9ASTE|nr:hypothetical protein DM860_003885 [Cuscuta australis]
MVPFEEGEDNLDDDVLKSNGLKSTNWDVDDGDIVPDYEDGDNDEDFDVSESHDPKSTYSSSHKGIIVPDSEDGDPICRFFRRCRVLIVLDSKDGDDDEDIDVPEFDGPKYVDCGGVEDIIVSDFEEGADDEDFDFPKSDDPKYVNSDCQHQMPNPMTEEKWWNLEALQYQSWFQNIPLA